MIVLVSGGTLAGSYVIYIQKKGIIGDRPSTRTMRISKHVGALMGLRMPLLMKQAYEAKARVGIEKKIKNFEIFLAR